MLIDANIFQPLIDVFEAVLKFFHNNVGVSWGFSIILLTVCVRLILAPLMIKQFRSMQRMQAHMPELKALQAKYKEDKQRQQQEVMKFYKENNVSPFSSCLPLVLQLPVFLSLFYMLRKSLRSDICQKTQLAFQHAYKLKHPGASASTVASQTTACGDNNHAGFLFIHDLTNTAHGLTLVILIVLYVGTQMASTMIMAQPTMDANQRRLMMFLPLIFVLFILRFPAGLIVYWITTNGWTMAQQFVFKKLMPPAIPVAVPVVASGRSARTPTAGNGRGAGQSGNGNGDEPAEGGVAGLIKRAIRPADSAGATSGRTAGSGKSGGSSKASSAGGSDSRAAGGPPPSSPRKKKKRSGRRR